MTAFKEKLVATGVPAMNSFEERNFTASDVVSVQPVRSELESQVYSEVMMYFLAENARRADAGRNDFIKFTDERDMFRAYWAEVLG